MLDDVIDASLFDLQGTLRRRYASPLCSGAVVRHLRRRRYLNDGIATPRALGWSGHQWTLLDNPKLPNAATAKATSKLKRKRNWADDNPTYLREYRGVWVDLSALFYKFDAVRNAHDRRGAAVGSRVVTRARLGQGARDDMALVIWGWHDDYPRSTRCSRGRNPAPAVKRCSTKSRNKSKEAAQPCAPGRRYGGAVAKMLRGRGDAPA